MLDVPVRRSLMITGMLPVIITETVADSSYVITGNVDSDDAATDAAIAGERRLGTTGHSDSDARRYTAAGNVAWTAQFGLTARFWFGASVLYRYALRQLRRCCCCCFATRTLG